MKVGRYDVTIHNHGNFRLDGGAMFGVVPKAMWSRWCPPDDENRILMATNSLIIQSQNRKLVIDLGCGDKWDAKSREIFCFPDISYRPVEGITDVLLTHLHFDHCGGISGFPANGQYPAPTYPNARHFVSGENLANARHPNVREKASYLPANVTTLDLVQTIETHDEQEIWPGLTVHRVDGHTRGLHWIKLTDEGTTVAFPSDLCPTSKHLSPPAVMGYDMCAERSLIERTDFFQQAVEGKWIVVFEHDPEVQAATLQFDQRGRATIKDQVTF